MGSGDTFFYWKLFSFSLSLLTRFSPLYFGWPFLKTIPLFMYFFLCRVLPLFLMFMNDPILFSKILKGR
ncbi:hypothetical protein BC829DRAFT_386904 [Chytridium lagenaria]|nr:hypothetical protein BC829DRAFT_386904 [Chytridium lagenaria]